MSEHKGLIDALAAAQGELENASKDGSNPHFGNKYATLASVLNEVRPVFSRHGLAFCQIPTLKPGPNPGTERFVLLTKLMHVSGEFEVSEYPIRPVKDDPQGLGGAISYARRYTIAAMSGCAQEDDDANTASDVRTEAKKQQKVVQGRRIKETAPDQADSNLYIHPDDANIGGLGVRGFLEQASSSQLANWLRNTHSEHKAKPGFEAAVAAAKLTAKIAPTEDMKLVQIDQRRTFCLALYDQIEMAKGFSSAPPAKASKPNDIKDTVEEFSRLRQELAASLIGHFAEPDEKANELYYQVLAQYGVNHSNQFLGAKTDDGLEAMGAIAKLIRRFVLLTKLEGK